MYVHANPNRARTAEEKEELKSHYTPGENVLPKIEIARESREEVDDRRMIEEARERSLRDVGIRSGPSYERGTRHRARRSENRTVASSSSRHASDREGHSRPPGDRDRQIEHQSSLRSLLSSSDIDSSELEEEILRQIIDDGMLDGIDLGTLDIAQEDELIERIAEGYRQRHSNRTRSRETSTVSNSQRPPTHHPVSSDNSPSQHGQPRSSRRSRLESQPSHPPISRPHLLEAYPVSPPNGRRTASETRRRTSPSLSPGPRRPSETQRQAARSATDLSTRTHASSAGSRTRTSLASGNVRRTTDPERLGPPTFQSDERRSSSSRNSMDEATQSRPSSSRSEISDPSGRRMLQPVRANRHQLENRREFEASHQTHGSLDRPSQENSSGMPPARVSENTETIAETFAEPSITCNRCGRSDLQYELHYNCGKCSNGEYNICLRCFHLGRGCLHWFGFGNAALEKYDRQTSLNAHVAAGSPPHRLEARKYLEPSSESILLGANNMTVRSTSSDPSTRLQAGPFCSICHTYAPQCFWKCDVCNDGEWGFCNLCLAQGSSCTHPLLPITLATNLAHEESVQASPALRTQAGTSFTPLSSATVDAMDALRSKEPFFQDKKYHSLVVSTKCAICTYPIAPSITRFHCVVCENGDYDICASCYQRLVSRGSVAADDGPNGWRRCPQGHRMMVVGFEDTTIGQRRLINRDLVGGRTLIEEREHVTSAEGPAWRWQEQGQQKRRAVKSAHPKAPSPLDAGVTSNVTANDLQPTLLKTYPPDGGAGMHVQALWGYWPQENAADELAFPRGAEIRECEDINGDWHWGVFCGRKGLFPGNFVKILRVVS